MARRHLAIFLKGVAEKILSGEKTVELRLSESKVLPYLMVAKDDEIYLKVTGGKIIGYASVENVLYYDKLRPAQIEEIKQAYFEKVAVEESFWQKKMAAKYATVIFLKEAKVFLSPIDFKKNDRRAWIIMEEN